MLGFDEIGPVAPQFKLGAHFGYAAGVALDYFMRQDFAILDRHRALGPEVRGGEVVIGDSLFRLVPPHDRFATVGAVVERVRYADGLPVQRALPTTAPTVAKRS